MMLKSPLVSLGLLLAIAVTDGACLDPLVSDDVEPAGLVRPPGSAIPSAHDDPEIDRQIADADGVDGQVPLLGGFAAGESVSYWDFGPTPDFAAPIFVLVERDDNDELILVPHNTIIDAIPGDPGYSPYWAVFFVEVTDQYSGELITSFAALEEAQALGLVYQPTLPTFAVNCPAVASDVTLEVGGGEEPLPPPSEFFWQGRTVKYYDFGLMPITDSAIAVESSVFVLSREGRAPLSEPFRGVDITGDGDTNDTNNIFSVKKGNDDYTPLCRQVDVTVPRDDLLLIDNSLDQRTSDLRDAVDLFNPDPVIGKVVSFETTDILGNCPQQSELGGL